MPCWFSTYFPIGNLTVASGGGEAELKGEGFGPLQGRQGEQWQEK